MTRGDLDLAQPQSEIALAQIEFGQLKIARLGNLQINLRAVDDGDRVAGALHNRSLVGAHKSVSHASAKALLSSP
jgi:hypothetical protein